MKMLKAVQVYIEENNLFTHSKQPVLVGLSGGADSVALLAVLVRLGYSCIALHCNFHLRGTESDRDETFSRDLAKQLEVPFYSIDFDTTDYAKRNHLSIEMAARELRYQWFEEMCEKWKAQAVAVAHHQDDSVETLLINLVRGTGIRGLSGISPKNGIVVRPFLALSRADICEWLNQSGYTYITDSSNLSDEFTRNFIRLRILPLLEEINPSVKKTIARTADNLADVALIYNNVIQEAVANVWKENEISIPDLLSYPAPETVLYELLRPYGFNRIQTQTIFLAVEDTRSSGKTFYSSTHRLIKNRQTLILSDIPEEEKEKTYLIKDENDVNHLPIELSFQKSVISVEFDVYKEKNIASFDCAKIHFPLTLRRWCEGDWFVPFGMKGKKKISDYFTDKKYSIPEKENTWLLCCGDDILWIVGERSDNRFRLDNTTKQALIVKKMREKR